MHSASGHSYVPSSSDPIIIIGAGCFGSSTAYHLLKAGFRDITILDQSENLPGPDIASNDINRIVRSSYSDRLYSQLAKEAIQYAKTVLLPYEVFESQASSLILPLLLEPGLHIRTSSVLIASVLAIAPKDSDSGIGADYILKSYENDLAMGSRVELYDQGNELREAFPPGCDLGSLRGFTGYLNHENGWVDAGRALRTLHQSLNALGCKLVPKKKVVQFVKTSQGSTRGVKCSDGSEYGAAIVVVASGAWTAGAFPDLQLNELYTATGQSVAMVQLSSEEAIQYQNTPVILSFDVDGFYVFPPTDQGVLKMALHGPGVTHRNSDGISTPRTFVTSPEDGHCIPKSSLNILRSRLKEVYPSLGGKPVLNTRLCWYNDTVDGDWVIGRRPSDPHLVMATGGSGHAFKFLPILGKLVVASILGQLDMNMSQRFSPERPKNAPKPEPSRVAQMPKPLVVHELCSSDDFV